MFRLKIMSHNSNVISKRFNITTNNYLKMNKVNFSEHNNKRNDQNTRNNKNSKSVAKIGENNQMTDELVEDIKSYNSLFKFDNRAIVSVTGKDAHAFLQSMITNDMNLLNEDPQRAAIFSVFLNPKGRILYDTIIIKSHLYI